MGLNLDLNARARKMKLLYKICVLDSVFNNISLIAYNFYKEEVSLLTAFMPVLSKYVALPRVELNKHF